jgi:phosphoglucosamine mutase
MMSREYFGTDGIRGTVGQFPITPDFALRLGHAVGQVLRRAGGGTRRPTVLIGKDTRISGYMLESALEAGFASAGVHVLLTGPLPTPGVAYLTRALRLDLGIVISASHNPFADNGIKFFSAKGEKLPDTWEVAVEHALKDAPAWVESSELGRARRLSDAQGRYVEFCKSTVSGELSLKGLKIVVDAAHGAAYQVAPAVFHELGGEVFSIGCSPNGVNINAGVGATSPSALVAAVREHGADFGVALDGDADRLQLVDHTGRLYNGDELLYVLALDRIAHGQRIPGVVGTLMTNMAIEVALADKEIELVRAKVGDRYVLEELIRRNWVLGGESSGHLLVLDKHSTGDGMVSALQILQALQHQSRPLHKLLEDVSLFPQTMINVQLSVDGSGNHKDWYKNRELAAEIERVTAMLGRSGRVLIRPSGTEPVLRVMVEARDESMAKSCAERLSDLARQVLGGR